MTYPINEKQHLTVDGVDTIELAKTYGTPLAVYDVTLIRKTMRAFKRIFEQENVPYVVSYAGKAFATKAIYQVAAQENIHADVVSGGELYTAIKADFPTQHLSFNGNNKSYDELVMAVENGVGTIIVDNFLELQLLSEITAEKMLFKIFYYVFHQEFQLILMNLLVLVNKIVNLALIYKQVKRSRPMILQ